MRRVLLLAFSAVLLTGVPALAAIPFTFGLYPAGPLDGITDVPGVRVGNLTVIRGSNIRTGATAILPDGDPWTEKVAAATVAFNGNGEMTGSHWIKESGYLEEPIVMTDTMDVGRADDGVVSWDIEHHPAMGVRDDVPLPVVMECDDQMLDDIQARVVHASDIVHLLDAAKPGQFARGSVGAGTGMAAFGFKAGIGSASRVIPKALGGYTVGVLVDDNTNGGGSTRALLTIDGVHVGQALLHQYPTTFHRPSHSIDVVVATNAPLDSRQLHALALRAALGMGRTGLISDTGSGDLFAAFSTGYVFHEVGNFDVKGPSNRPLDDDDAINALYGAADEATQAAIYDALFNARTMTGRGVTVPGLPVGRVLEMLRAAGIPVQ